MEKRIGTEQEVSSIIEKRWSPRAIIGPMPPEEKLMALFEAARWAPSAFNEQPWHFIVTTAQQPETFQKALECLLPGNRVWVQHAPLLIFGVYKTYFDRNNAPNIMAPFDLGLAVENLMLEAVTQDLVTHSMSGFIPEKTRNTFSIPQGYEPYVAIAAGYLGSPESLEEPLREIEKTERSRKPLRDFVFSGTWGQNLIS